MVPKTFFSGQLTPESAQRLQGTQQGSDLAREDGCWASTDTGPPAVGFSHESQGGDSENVVSPLPSVWIQKSCALGAHVPLWSGHFRSVLRESEIGRAISANKLRQSTRDWGALETQHPASWFSSFGDWAFMWPNEPLRLGFVIPSYPVNKLLLDLTESMSCWASQVEQGWRICLPMQETWIWSWIGKIPWEGKSNPLQYSCPENPMDRGAWRATVHEVTKSQTRLSTIRSTAQPVFLPGKPHGQRNLVDASAWGHKELGTT